MAVHHVCHLFILNEHPASIVALLSLPLTCQQPYFVSINREGGGSSEVLHLPLHLSSMVSGVFLSWILPRSKGWLHVLALLPERKAKTQLLLFSIINHQNKDSPMVAFSKLPSKDPVLPRKHSNSSLQVY
ncbi:hypothetical protein CEXT_556581 [Caerostris extrusa]|uniref:Uncharacterized protein n=1 Tax=Caerostris extrusa TaxID=172846 RepID=A0AAV4MF21_CAEEX|nr:hypothetical protein CEXT_556581 [Caerostris extrusa]